MDLFDMIGPVMIGPSSSHTAGAARIGFTARMLLGQSVKRAEIGLCGSFAKTGRGHGTDRAIVGGLLGMGMDDPRIRDAFTLAEQAGLELRFTEISIRGAHPNTARLELTGVHGAHLLMEAASVGGGMIDVRRLDGLKVGFSGRENTLIIHHQDEPGRIAAVTTCIAEHRLNIATMQVYRQDTGKEAIMVLELDSPVVQGVLDEIRAMEGICSAAFLKGAEE